MIEAKLRVETLENRSNPIYGDTLVKKVTEESCYHDKDERSQIAPSGIKATLKVGNVVMDITINRYCLEHELTGCDFSRYTTFFSINDKVYEICVWFDTNDEIKNVSLSEWLSEGSFEDGDDADNVYWSDEHFVTLTSYIS